MNAEDLQKLQLLLGFYRLWIDADKALQIEISWQAQQICQQLSEGLIPLFPAVSEATQTEAAVL